MIKASIKLDKRRKLNNGKYPLKIKIARKDSAFYLRLPYELKNEEWDARTGKVKNLPERKSINLWLEKKLTSIKEKIYALQESGRLRLYSNKRLQQYLLNECEANNEHLFKVQLENFLESKEKENTKQIYINTKRKLKNFCDYDTLMIEDIDIEWLDNFVEFLKKENNSINTIGLRLRSVRSIVNYAKKKKVIKEYVFDNYRIKQEETRKRNLNLEELRKLYKAELTDRLSVFRDLFFLVFFLMGINLVDLSTVKNVVNGRIQYKRAKTGTFYDIKVEPEALDIIDKYKSDNCIVGIISKYVNYRQFERAFNNALKLISKELALPSLSVYWARHSFATIAYDLGINTDVIADCLGHKTGHKITEIYIQKDQRKVDEANRRVIDYVLYGKK